MNASTFLSNTHAAAGNQTYFDARGDEVRVSRVYVRIAVAGSYRYSLFFSNTIDSTFADGSISCHDMICDAWEILEARVAPCRDITMAPFSCEHPLAFLSLTFDGKPHKTVAAAEHFRSDPLLLTFDEGDYLCVELTYRGTRMPYHEESLLPIFIKTAGGWIYDRRMPLPAMIGCDRPIKARVGFIGDSITQGIGTPPNTYSHWTALLGDALGTDYAFHNLGIGYGRASDMAAGGVWFEKALQNDIVFVCYGVNDILQGASAAQLIADLDTIVHRLNNAGKTIILQTVPPFDYDAEKLAVWHTVNDHIRRISAQTVALCFDNTPLLGADGRARFGGHPNAEGCALWAAALYQAVKGVIAHVNL